MHRSINSEIKQGQKKQQCILKICQLSWCHGKPASSNILLQVSRFINFFCRFCRPPLFVQLKVPYKHRRIAKYRIKHHSIWFRNFFPKLQFNQQKQLVLVITCLGGHFGINCPSAFLKILKCFFRNNYFGSQPFLTRCYFAKIFVHLSVIIAVCYFSMFINW